MFNWNWRGWLRALVSPRKRPAQTPRRLDIDRLEERTVPSATAVISGHAFTDVTGNGMSADDVAKRGVTIQLFSDSNRNGKLDWCDIQVASQNTKSDGSYAFTRLRPGTYFVVDHNPDNHVQTGPTVDKPYKITIGNGQSATGNDFNYFKLLSDKGLQNVSYTIQRGDDTFTVRDLRGNTQEGDIVTVNFTIKKGSAPLTLSLVSYDAPGSKFKAKDAHLQTIADLDTGTFGPGRHSLSILIPESNYQIDFVLGQAIDKFGPKGSNIFYSAQHRLISADNGGTQAQTDGSISGFIYSDNDANSLVNDGDTGIAGVTVLLTGTNDLGKSVSLTTITDVNGHFAFDGLRAGVYSIEQLPPGNYIPGTEIVGSLGGTAASPVLISDIHLGNGKNGVNYNFLDLPVVQQQTYSVSGAVLLGEALYVEITDTTTGETYTNIPIDENGNYSFAGLSAGHSFEITAVAPPGLLSTTIRIESLNSDLTNQDLLIVPPS